MMRPVFAPNRESLCNLVGKKGPTYPVGTVQSPRDKRQPAYPVADGLSQTVSFNGPAPTFNGRAGLNFN